MELLAVLCRLWCGGRFDMGVCIQFCALEAVDVDSELARYAQRAVECVYRLKG